MNRIIELIMVGSIITTMATGCSDESEYLAIQEANKAKIAEASSSGIRTPDEAIQAAERAAKTFNQANNLSRGVCVNRKVDPSICPIPVGSHPSSRSNPSDTLLYAVNYSNNDGFALVSAIKSTPEIIAYIPEGSYNVAPNDNPGFNLFLEAAREYLTGAKTLSDNGGNSSAILPPPYKPADIYNEVRDTTYTTNVPNRVRVFWSQYDVEGDSCPNQTSGCSITAAAMAMSHWGYPTSIKLTYNYSNRTQPLDWEKMRQHKKMVDLSDHNIQSGCDDPFVCNDHKGISMHEGCTDESHKMISLLCRELGARAKTEYYNDGSGSGTYTSDLVKALRGLGYNAITKEYNAGKLVTDLETSDCVLLMEGSRKDAQGQKHGHMWVCDATYCYNVHVTSYVSHDMGFTWSKNFERTDYYIYNYYNWGWGHDNSGTSYNGYYISFIFQPQNDAQKSDRNYNLDIKYTKVTKL